MFLGDKDNETRTNFFCFKTKGSEIALKKGELFAE